MIDLQQFKAKICYTAAGHLIADGKVLLIKHKKLQSWMSPGGHIEENELPHQAAEREFFEETGLRVKAMSLEKPYTEYPDAEILPQPLLVNLHWVSEKNYSLRVNNEESKIKNKNNPWKKGCEQHIGFIYLMKPVDSLDFYQNVEETDGIAWFSVEQLDEIEMFDNVRTEIKHSFKLNLI